MNICGIVAEYNPFHNGHKYQIEKARENGATHIVAFMSGNFVQRGDIAVSDKFTRARRAVCCGADLVIEIPVLYCLASAEYYAKAAYSLIEGLGCIDSVSFGCECDDLDLLKEAANFSNSMKEKLDIKDVMSEGISFPSAMQSLANEKICDLFSSPNNILSIEYLKQIENRELQVEIYPIKRTGTEHDSDYSHGNIASASFIRKLMSENADYSVFVPYSDFSAEIVDYKALESVVFYKLRTMNLSEICDLPEASEELASRIYNSIRSSSSFEDFLFKVKTKRYPLSRIRRVIYTALIELNRSDYNYEPPYIRVLALNKNGAEVLKKARTTAKIPIDTSFANLSKQSDICKKFVETENRATDIYSLLVGKKVFGSDMTAKIEITESCDEF